MTERVVDGAVYIQSPLFAGLDRLRQAVGEGRSRRPRRRRADDLGTGQSDPTQMLDYLRGLSEGVTRVGSMTTCAASQATHYHAEHQPAEGARQPAGVAAARLRGDRCKSSGSSVDPDRHLGRRRRPRRAHRRPRRTIERQRPDRCSPTCRSTTSTSACRSTSTAPPAEPGRRPRRTRRHARRQLTSRSGEAGRAWLSPDRARASRWRRRRPDRSIADRHVGPARLAPLVPLHRVRSPATSSRTSRSRWPAPRPARSPIAPTFSCRDHAVRVDAVDQVARRDRRTSSSIQGMRTSTTSPCARTRLVGSVQSPQRNVPRRRPARSGSTRCSGRISVGRFRISLRRVHTPLPCSRSARCTGDELRATPYCQAIGSTHEAQRSLAWSPGPMVIATSAPGSTPRGARAGPCCRPGCMSRPMVIGCLRHASPPCRGAAAGTGAPRPSARAPRARARRGTRRSPGCRSASTRGRGRRGSRRRSRRTLLVGERVAPELPAVVRHLHVPGVPGELEPLVGPLEEDPAGVALAVDVLQQVGVDRPASPSEWAPWSRPSGPKCARPSADGTPNSVTMIGMPLWWRAERVQVRRRTGRAGRPRPPVRQLGRAA